MVDNLTFERNIVVMRVIDAAHEMHPVTMGVMKRDMRCVSLKAIMFSMNTSSVLKKVVY